MTGKLTILDTAEHQLAELKIVVRRYLATDPVEDVETWCSLSERLAVLVNHRDGEPTNIQKLRAMFPMETDVALFYSDRVWWREGTQGHHSAYDILLGDTNRLFSGLTLSGAMNEASKGAMEALLINKPTPDELCAHVELGAEQVGGFFFTVESLTVGMCQGCLDWCLLNFENPITWKEFQNANQCVSDCSKFGD